MVTATVKSQAHDIADRLAEDATWDDLQYQIYVRQAIEAGLKDADEGRLIDHEEICRRNGIEIE